MKKLTMRIVAVLMAVAMLGTVSFAAGEAPAVYAEGDNVLYYNAGTTANPDGITASNAFRNDSVLGTGYTGRGIGGKGGGNEYITVPVSAAIGDAAAYTVQFKMNPFLNSGSAQACVFIPSPDGKAVKLNPAYMKEAGLETCFVWYDCVVEMNGSNVTWYVKLESSSDWVTATAESVARTEMKTGGQEVLLESIYVFQKVESAAVRAINAAKDVASLKAAYAAVDGLDLTGASDGFYAFLLGRTFLTEEEVLSTIPGLLEAYSLGYVEGDKLLYYNAGTTANPDGITASSGTRNDSVVGGTGRGIGGAGGGAHYITVPVSAAIGNATVYTVQFKMNPFANSGTSQAAVLVPAPGGKMVKVNPYYLNNAGLTETMKWYDCVITINGSNYTWKAKLETSSTWTTIEGEALAASTTGGNIITGGQEVLLESIYVFQKIEEGVKAINDAEDVASLKAAYEAVDGLTLTGADNAFYAYLLGREYIAVSEVLSTIPAELDAYLAGCDEENILYYNAAKIDNPAGIISTGEFRTDSVLGLGTNRGIAANGNGSPYLTVPVADAIGAATTYGVQFKANPFDLGGHQQDDIYIPVPGALSATVDLDAAVVAGAAELYKWSDFLVEINGANYTVKAKLETASEWITVVENGVAEYKEKPQMVTGGKQVALEAIYVYAMEAPEEPEVVTVPVENVYVAEDGTVYTNVAYAKVTMPTDGMLVKCGISFISNAEGATAIEVEKTFEAIEISGEFEFEALVLGVPYDTMVGTAIIATPYFGYAD